LPSGEKKKGGYRQGEDNPRSSETEKTPRFIPLPCPKKGKKKDDQPWRWEGGEEKDGKRLRFPKGGGGESTFLHLPKEKDPGFVLGRRKREKREKPPCPGLL